MPPRWRAHKDKLLLTSSDNGTIGRPPSEVVPAATLETVAEGAGRGGTGGVGRICGREAPAERGACVAGGTTSRSTLTADASAPGTAGEGAGAGCSGGGDTCATLIGCDNCTVEV